MQRPQFGFNCSILTVWHILLAVSCCCTTELPLGCYLDAYYCWQKPAFISCHYANWECLNWHLNPRQLSDWIYTVANDWFQPFSVVSFLYLVFALYFLQAKLYSTSCNFNQTYSHRNFLECFWDYEYRLISSLAGAKQSYMVAVSVLGWYVVQLLIYTASRCGATLSFIWSHICVHRMNLSPIFTHF